MIVMVWCGVSKAEAWAVFKRPQDKVSNWKSIQASASRYWNKEPVKSALECERYKEVTLFKDIREGVTKLKLGELSTFETSVYVFGRLAEAGIVDIEMFDDFIQHPRFTFEKNKEILQAVKEATQQNYEAQVDAVKDTTDLDHEITPKQIDQLIREEELSGQSADTTATPNGQTQTQSQAPSPSSSQSYNKGDSSHRSYDRQRQSWLDSFRDIENPSASTPYGIGLWLAIEVITQVNKRKAYIEQHKLNPIDASPYSSTDISAIKAVLSALLPFSPTPSSDERKAITMASVIVGLTADEVAINPDAFTAPVPAGVKVQEDIDIEPVNNDPNPEPVSEQ